jgi:hypothetical protein
VSELFVGIDLGQARDHTAIVVVERVDYIPPPASLPDPPVQRMRKVKFLLDQRAPIPWPPRPPASPPPKPELRYNVRHGERLRLGTPYPEAVKRVRWILDNLGADAALVVDATGVGRPVVDLFEAARVYPVAVTITAGEAMVQDGYRYRVPKRDLVTSIEVLLQERRLKIGRDIPDSGAIVDELLSFRASVAASGRDTFGAEGAGHDDLVIALGLALWFGRLSETRPPRGPSKGVSERYEDQDDRDALWLGDPEYQHAFGYHGGGSRFIGGGCGGITSPRYTPFRFR